MSSAAVDVHQHLWPAALVEALRQRSTPPLLRGWALHLAGEPPFDVDPADHDVAVRAAGEAGTALVSLSSPLGIEQLPVDESVPLLAAWHDGARELGGPFGAWASVSAVEPDLDGLKQLLTEGFVGLQVPATSLRDPHAVERLAPMLELCETLGSPVLVHPGAVPASGSVEPWWPALVDYPAQQQAAWWAWHAVGRSLLPRLRLCFVAGAGLAPLHHERFAARSGRRFVVDHDVFVDTSSYGRQGIDALTRTLGIDVVVLASDRPYAEPPAQALLDLGAAAWHAVAVSNPNRLLEGTT
ncbi:amidohydrolase family protein [uncultured Jatrophihabitans sp.]|uniref:amidohydrolase family protein n=1 Tax=uncultured Jatrophihabitans sp. TaxID=1610747 RepID=UPI0035CA2463